MNVVHPLSWKYKSEPDNNNGIYTNKIHNWTRICIISTYTTSDYQALLLVHIIKFRKLMESGGKFSNPFGTPHSTFALFQLIWGFYFIFIIFTIHLFVLLAFKYFNSFKKLKASFISTTYICTLLSIYILHLDNTLIMNIWAQSFINVLPLFCVCVHDLKIKLFSLWCRSTYERNLKWKRKTKTDKKESFLEKKN